LPIRVDSTLADVDAPVIRKNPAIAFSAHEIGNFDGTRDRAVKGRHIRRKALQMVEHDAHLGQVGDRPLPDRGQHLTPPRQCRTAILAQRPDGIKIRHGDFLAIDAYRAGLRIVDEIVFTRLANA